MNKREILNIIKKHYDFDKDVKFAQFLGISSQSLSNWKSRNTFDVEIICQKCEEINPEWLISGRGNMLKNMGALLKFKENNKRIPYLPFEEITLHEIDDLNIENFESHFFIMPVFNDADYLTEVKSISLYPKYCSGDIIACKKINIFDLFFQSEKTLDKEYVIVTEQETLFKKIKTYNMNDFYFLLSDNHISFELCISKIKSISIVLGTIRLT